MTSRIARLAVLLCSTAAASGCGQSDIAVHESHWNSLSPSSYTYRFQWSCFCAGDFVAPVDITVTTGAITAVKNHDTGAALLPARFTDYRTIPGLFAFLHEAARRNAARIVGRGAVLPPDRLHRLRPERRRRRDVLHRQRPEGAALSRSAATGPARSQR